jgi:putative nucleotidyltransferase with HDIG domain
MDETQILKRLDRIREIPTLTSIVFELNKLLQDPDTSVARISQTIEKDQAIALKILKLVNSAFYGSKHRISDVRNAVIMLGFNAVRNAIVSVSVIDAFSGLGRLKNFDISDFWKHSLAVAVTSKNISLKTRRNSPDNCFVGGLLHDVGKVVLAQYLPDLFADVWNTLQSEGGSFLAAEQRVLPAPHPVLGAHLASKWQLPPGLVDALRWHHDHQPESDNADFILIIHLANIIVNSFEENPECVIDLGALHPEARKFLMNSLQNIGDWYAGIVEEIEAAHAFFLPAR